MGRCWSAAGVKRKVKKIIFMAKVQSALLSAQEAMLVKEQDCWAYDRVLARYMRVILVGEA
eukprot:8319703-Lingulodinium_polyedra.AAC.1